MSQAERSKSAKPKQPPEKRKSSALQNSRAAKSGRSAGSKGVTPRAQFGPTAPLVSDEKGGYTRPVNFRKRYYRILKAAGIEQKELHSLRHTFGSSLVNGIKQPDGTLYGSLAQAGSRPPGPQYLTNH